MVCCLASSSHSLNIEHKSYSRCCWRFSHLTAKITSSSTRCDVNNLTNSLDAWDFWTWPTRKRRKMRMRGRREKRKRRRKKDLKKRGTRRVKGEEAPLLLVRHCNFRCTDASLWEGMSVCRSVTPSLRCVLCVSYGHFGQLCLVALFIVQMVYIKSKSIKYRAMRELPITALLTAFQIKGT